MKIAIVTPYALPEKGAASMRIISFAKYFKEKGYEVQLIAPFRKYDDGENVKRYKKISELIEFIKGNDIIIITTPPITTAFRLVNIIKHLKIPLVIDVRDLAENGKYKILKIIMEKYVLRRAKKITTVTPYMKDFFSKKYKIESNKIELVPNGVDTDIFYQNRAAGQKIRSQLDIPENATVIVYEGIIGDHELNLFLKLIGPNFLKEHDLYILLLLIVGETEKQSKFLLQKLKNIIKERKITSRLRIVQNISPNNLYAYLSAGNFGLDPIPSTVDNLYRIPVKTYEYLACGLPLLCKGPKNGELERFIKKNKFGVFYSSWRELIGDISNLKKLKKNIKIKNIKRFEREKYSKRMLSEAISLKKDFHKDNNEKTPKKNKICCK